MQTDTARQMSLYEKQVKDSIRPGVREYVGDL